MLDSYVLSKRGKAEIESFKIKTMDFYRDTFVLMPECKESEKFVEFLNMASYYGIKALAKLDDNHLEKIEY